MDKHITKSEYKTILETAPPNADRRAILKTIVANGYIVEGFNDGTVMAKPKKPLGKEGGLLDRTKDRVVGQIEKAQADKYDVESGEGGFGTYLSGIGHTARALSAPLEEIGSAVMEKAAPVADFALFGAKGTPVRTLVDKGREVVGKNVVQPAIDNFTQAGERISETNPELAKGASGVVNIAQAVGEIAGLGSGVSSVKNKVSSTVNKVKDARKVSALNKSTEATLKPQLDTKVIERAAKDPVFAKKLETAKKQGFEDSDVNFLSSVSDVDRPVMKEMFETANKAQSNPRQIRRSADILGENVSKQATQIQDVNRKAGQGVEEAAETLRGQKVDVSGFKQKVVDKLKTKGVQIENGRINFDDSEFSLTPKIQEELTKALRSIPDGSDAHKLHVFKKTMDSIVKYGVAGEGLKGSSANLLKFLRREADNVLDTNFPEYNKVNTQFKETQEYLDVARKLAGKGRELSGKSGAQSFGQALRSAFSNNKSRPDVLKFIEDTQQMGKKLQLSGSEQNILDQALYVQILERTFGSEAATGLASEVAKGIKTAVKGIDIVRNPVSGGLNAIADVVEKAQNITPEAKKAILKAFTEFEKGAN